MWNLKKEERCAEFKELKKALGSREELPDDWYSWTGEGNCQKVLGVSSGKRSAVKYSKEDVSNEKVGASKKRAYNELFVRPNTKEKGLSSID